MPAGRAPRRTCVNRLRVCLALWGLLPAAVAIAAPPTLSPHVPSCVQRLSNSVIELSVQPETGWSSVRLYFRKTGSQDFYFLEMRSAGKGVYWAALPRPEDATTAVELQLSVKDGEGEEDRAPMQKVPVVSPCRTVLTKEESTYAQNLVVGETMPSQAGLVVSGFVCEGIISRINASGRLQPDEVCRRVQMAYAIAEQEENRKGLLPVVPVGGGSTIIRQTEKTEASKPRP